MVCDLRVSSCFATCSPKCIYIRVCIRALYIIRSKASVGTRLGSRVHLGRHSAGAAEAYGTDSTALPRWVCRQLSVHATAVHTALQQLLLLCGSPLVCSTSGVPSYTRLIYLLHSNIRLPLVAFRALSFPFDAVSSWQHRQGYDKPFRGMPCRAGSFLRPSRLTSYTINAEHRTVVIPKDCTRGEAELHAAVVSKLWCSLLKAVGFEDVGGGVRRPARREGGAA